MPLPGGAADKFGNRYEGRWTVYCMLRVLHEEATSIHLEPVGDEGKGVEFTLRAANGTKEFHQVKRQHSGQGPWSLHKLGAEQILSNFWDKLQATDAECVFVSLSSADQLRELSERARSARDVTEFTKELIKAQQASSNFHVLRQKWGNGSVDEAYRALKRVRVETWSEEALQREIEYRLSTLVSAPPQTASDVLAQLALESVHQELNGVKLWQRLNQREVHRRAWNNDPHVLAAVEAANKRYLSPLRKEAILGKPIPRDETQTVLAKLQKGHGKKVVLVSGDAGAGKTGVAAEVIENAQTLAWPTLAFRMDRLEPVATSRKLGEQMELPESPVNVLANIAQGADCLLLIDQLDAVSTTSGRNPQFFERVDEMIHQSAVHPNMRLVLFCRRFDLANDERLQRLTGEQGVADEVTVGALSQDTVRHIVGECGISPERLSDKQLTLLSVPLHLKILTELLPVAMDNADRVLRFDTLKDLYDQYWDHKQRTIRERRGPQVRWGQVLDLVIARMTQDLSLSAPTSVLDDFDLDREAMLSEGVLVQDGKRISFFHDTFFDYAFARRFIGQGKSLLLFLRSQEQHLFLRATVRQILTHERAEDINNYLADVEELLVAPDIRFHLKHLTFQLLRALPDPVRGEWDIVRQFLFSPSEELANQAWEVVSSKAWFALLEPVMNLGDRLMVYEPQALPQRCF